MENKAKNHLLSHAVLMGGCTLLAKGIAFLLIPLYTACLTPAQYGTVDVLLETAALLLPFASLCAPEALFRFVAGGEARAPSLASGLRLLLFGLLALGVIAPWLCLWHTLRPFVPLLFLYVAGAVMHAFFSQYLRALGYYGAFALQQLLCAAANAMLAAMLLYRFRLGVTGYLLSVIAADALACAAVIAFLLKRKFLKQRKASKEGMLRMLRFALPLVPTSALVWVGGVLDRYLLLYFWGSTAVGLLAAAGKIPSLLGFALSAFLSAWHYDALRKDEAARADFFVALWQRLFPLLLLGCGGLILLAPPAAALLLSPQYHSALTLIPFLCISALFLAFSTLWGSVYTLFLASSASLVTSLAGLLCHVLLSLLFVPRFGAFGAVVAATAGYVTVFWLRISHCRRRFKIVTDAPVFLSALLLLAAAAFAAYRQPLCALLCLLGVLFWHRHAYRQLLLAAAGVFWQIIAKIMGFVRKKF